DKAPGPDLAEFRALAALAREGGLHLQTGYHYRYTPAITFALRAVREGLLGEILNLVAQNRTTLHNYEERREVEAYPGGIFFEIGSHFLDLAMLILGRPQHITSFLQAVYQSDGKPPY